MTQEQTELFKPDFGWFHFFRTLIRNGTWSKMSLASKAIYPVIKSYINTDGIAFPSNATIMEKAGLSKASVTSGLKELVQLGLLKTITRPNKTTCYEIVDNFELQHPKSDTSFEQPITYVPSQISAIVKELQAFIATGEKGKIIQINFNLNSGAGNQTNNNIIDAGEQLQNIIEMLEKNTCG